MLQITNRTIIAEAEKRGWKTRIVDEYGGFIAVTPPNKSELLLKSCADPAAGIANMLIASNKEVFYNLASKAGLPVPITQVYKSIETSRKFLAKHKNIVVKPASASHGNGVSLGVSTIEQLKIAVKSAQKHSSKVLLQKQYSGADYRLLVIDGVVVAGAQRLPATVVGDGKRNIQELIEYENTKEERGEGYQRKLSYINMECAEKYLGTAKLATVPKLGEAVKVFNVPNIGQGGTSIDITELVPPAINKIALEASEVAGLKVCGVDFLTDNIADSTADEVVIVEVNAIPSFGLHELPVEGKPRKVTAAFLDYILKL